MQRNGLEDHHMIYKGVIPVEQIAKTENEQKKEYLREYRKHAKRIKRIESELEEIRSMKQYPAAKIGDGMPHGSNNSDLSDYAAVLDKMEHDLERERFLKIKSYTEINKYISLLKSETERDLLHYRYIKGMAWWEVAEKMECSEREVYRKHGKALNNFELPEIRH